ncbi:4Fe-4S binding domain-containing protein [Hymenobacter gelipurpurascens]|uniref:4Fe-4S binding domain-containing protein n=1 Tax=Hymenobacter gelipurpurascens TaxID=89968 RepID=A0A212TET3_9BACT|nr:4Fe-4S dicluster domain-containing protein [Hymenobacter gelipurpurascens]SNC64539.1 4Fe-4S binding domain-containing protein [Hymenobacter gelipurpurascens]
MLPSLSLPTPPLPTVSATEKLLLTIIGLGLLALLPATFAADAWLAQMSLYAAMTLVSMGTLLWAARKFAGKPAGVQQDNLWLRSSTSRGAVAWLTAVVLTGFYVLLYWFSSPDEQGNFGFLNSLVHSLDPLSQAIRQRPSDQWFLYGTFYTLAILLMGGRALWKYRHSPYQRIRTASVMFFQLGFAWLLPGVLLAFQRPEYYFSYFWPLKYDYLFPGTVGYLLKDGGPGLGVFMVFWGAVMSFVGTPILTYFFGKRWYCSWVCGCGGLAETAGDPYRHLSDKSREAWRWEVRIIYPILAFIVLVTVLLWLGVAGTLPAWFTTVQPSSITLFSNLSPVDALSKFYGFAIGAVFSGVVGVGFYPLMGSRVWCRFGCPMAAYLGILQKYLSRFRITTNGAQCISCGNCSNVCEMGIDVKQYAQRGEPIIRASCVGCGMCSTVCPRGVLNLENGPRDGRYQGSQLITAESLRILS